MLALCSTLSQYSGLCLSIIPHIVLEIDLFPVLNSFVSAAGTKKLTGVPFLFVFVAEVN